MSGFQISGLGSGIDWGALVGQVIQADTQALINTVGRREVNLSQQQAVYSNVQGAMTNLRSSFQAFQSAGNFKTKVSSSSDAAIVTASATPSAAVSSVKVKVLSMATQAEARMSFESTDAVVHNGDEAEIKLIVRGIERTLKVPNNTTLSELGDIINAANIGVRANVYNTNDGSETPARLALTDIAMGAWENPDDLPNIQFVDFANTLSNVDVDPTYIEPEQTVVEINGEQIVRNNHVISDIIPGVNLQIKSADPEKEVTISINDSTQNAGNAIKKMVEAYNNVFVMLKQALASNPGAETQTNPTASDSTLRSVLTQMQSEITRIIPGIANESEISSLADIGVTSINNTANPGQNGQLQFDESKFNAALNSKFEDVVKFFEGYRDENDQKVEGFADKMDKIMAGFLASGTGAITSRIDSIKQQIDRVTDEKLRKIEQIERKEERLTARFARLEAQLGGLSSQQGTLDSALQSLANTQRAISNRRT